MPAPTKTTQLSPEPVAAPSDSSAAAGSSSKKPAPLPGERCSTCSDRYVQHTPTGCKGRSGCGCAAFTRGAKAVREIVAAAPVDPPAAEPVSLPQPAAVASSVAPAAGLSPATDASRSGAEQATTSLAPALGVAPGLDTGSGESGASLPTDRRPQPVAPTVARSGPAEYAAIKAMNWSTLKHLARSPKMFKYRLLHPEPVKPAYDFGSAFHCAVLEPKAFDERYVVEPDFGNLRTNAAKAERDAWRAENTARVAISQADMDAIRRMAEAVHAHRVARELLEGARAEHAITWTDAETGIACKSRLDMLCRNSIADLKTSRDPAPRPFALNAAQHLYHAQLAMYHDGAIASGAIPRDADTPYIIVPEKTEPFDVVVYRMHLNMALDPGRKVYRGLLRRFLECEAANWFPGIAPELRLLELPMWAVEAAGSGAPDLSLDGDLS